MKAHKNSRREQYRRMQKDNRTAHSEKKSAVNERIQLWRHNWLKKRKKCKYFDKLFPEYVVKEALE